MYQDLSQGIQCILLRIYQYRIRILYKPGPDVFIVDWLLRHNHTGNKDTVIPGMTLNIDTVNMMTDNPACMSVNEIQEATQKDAHLWQLKECIINGWPGSTIKCLPIMDI